MMPEAFTGPLARLESPLSIPTVRIRPGSSAFEVSLRPPGSKSLTNRAILLAALARGESTISHGLLDADDGQAMLGAVRGLGAHVELSASGVLRVRGVDGFRGVGNEVARAVTDVLDARDAGTVARFLAGAAVLGRSALVVDGSARLRERPMGPLADVLSKVGARIEYLERVGCVPMRITPPTSRGVPWPTLDLDSSMSSQFASALLLIGPWIPGGVTLRLTGEVASASYISMTLGLLGRLGANVLFSENRRILRVGPARPTGAHNGARPLGLDGFDLDIEPDASSATFFWAAAALVPGASVRILGVSNNSLQGDAGFPQLLERMGATVRTPGSLHANGLVFDLDGADESYLEITGGPVIRPILADVNDIPDSAVPLAVVAAFASGVSIVRGVRTLRVKESDRIAALGVELAKIGVRVTHPVSGDDDVMSITPPAGGVDLSEGAPPVVFDTHRDHRMAMALSLVGLRRPNVSISDPASVGKTYPSFWSDFSRLFT